MYFAYSVLHLNSYVKCLLDMFTTKKPFVILHLGSILSETIPSENFIPHGNKHLAHILGNVTVYRHYACLCHLIERGGFMRIGFIGAGKVGFTLGKYFPKIMSDLSAIGAVIQSRRKLRQNLQIQCITLMSRIWFGIVILCF